MLDRLAQRVMLHADFRGHLASAEPGRKQLLCLFQLVFREDFRSPFPLAASVDKCTASKCGISFAVADDAAFGNVENPHYVSIATGTAQNEGRCKRPEQPCVATLMARHWKDPVEIRPVVIFIYD